MKSWTRLEAMKNEKKMATKNVRRKKGAESRRCIVSVTDCVMLTSLMDTANVQET